MVRFLALFTLLATSWPATAATFNGFECTDDCSGHEAGYAWAEDREPDDETDCADNSQSFYEGCVAWLRDRDELRQAEDQFYSEQGRDY